MPWFEPVRPLYEFEQVLPDAMPACVTPWEPPAVGPAVGSVGCVLLDNGALMPVRYGDWVRVHGGEVVRGDSMARLYRRVEDMD